MDGLGMRLRVRGSSVSMKPVSRKSPESPIRQEMPSVGSAIENDTVQPPLWRENAAIGALTLSVGGPVRGTDAGGSAATFCAGSAALAACVGSFIKSLATPLRKTLSTIWSE